MFVEVNMKTKLIIIGANGHGKVVADIAKKFNKYGSIAFLDDNASITECLGYSVVGTSDKIAEYVDDAEFFVAIGNPTTRKKVTERIVSVDGKLATLVHPDAIIAEGVIIGEGTVVMAGAVVNPETVVGKGCIVNTCSSVDHDCKLGDFVHVAVGAHIAGTVVVGDNTWIGAGATVSNNVSICADCMIGAGAVIVKDITEAGTYIGVPATRKE